MAQKSNTKDALPDTGPIYDLIYVNRKRLLNYLAQIEEAGLLREISIQKGATDSETASSSWRFGTAGAGYSGTSTTSDAFTDGRGQTYDPAQKLPFQAFHFLGENGYLNTEASITPIGGLLIVEGNLELYDYKFHVKMFDRLTEYFSIEKTVKEEMKTIRNNTVTASMVKNTFKEMVKNISPPIIGSIGNIWGTLDENFLNIPRDDLILKYSTLPRIPGKWTMLCMMDTLPDQPEDYAEHRGWIGRDENGEVAGIHMPNLLRRLKELFGRPPKAYGVTPLMIFREISRKK